MNKSLQNLRKCLLLGSLALLIITIGLQIRNAKESLCPTANLWVALGLYSIQYGLIFFMMLMHFVGGGNCLKNFPYFVDIACLITVGT